MAKVDPNDVEILPVGGKVDPRDVQIDQAPAPSRMDRLLSALKGAAGEQQYAQTAPLRLMMNPEAELSASGQTGAALRGVLHGGTFGFSDELRGLSGAKDEAVARGANALTGGSKVPGPSFVDALKARYRNDRDTARAEEDTSAKAFPATHGAAEVVSMAATPNPFGKLAAAGRVGRVAASAGAGELFGLGASRSADAPGILRDTAEGGAWGLGGAAVGEGAGAVAAKGKGIMKNAAAEQAAKEESALSKDVASERGRLGGISGGVLGDFDRAEAMLSNPAATAAQKAKAIAFIDSPEGQRLRQISYDNLNERLPGRMNETNEARGAYDAAVQRNTPATAEALAAEKLKGGMWSEAKPRLMRIAQRTIPTAAGLAIGHGAGPLGMAAGGIGGAIIGAAMGHPGTTLANMAKAPAFRYGAGKALRTIAAPAAETGAPQGLEQWLQKKPDDEREAEGADFFTKATGGR